MNFPKHSVGFAEGSVCTKNELDPFSRFDTTPACDRRQTYKFILARYYFFSTICRYNYTLITHKMLIYNQLINFKIIIFLSFSFCLLSLLFLRSLAYAR